MREREREEKETPNRSSEFPSCLIDLLFDLGCPCLRGFEWVWSGRGTFRIQIVQTHTVRTTSGMKNYSGKTHCGGEGTLEILLISRSGETNEKGHFR